MTTAAPRTLSHVVTALSPRTSSATSLPLSGYDKRLMLFAGRSNPELAAKIANKLGLDLGGVTLKTFSNGEVYCRYEESIRGADVFIVQPTCGNPAYDPIVWVGATPTSAVIKGRPRSPPRCPRRDGPGTGASAGPGLVRPGSGRAADGGGPAGPPYLPGALERGDRPRFRGLGRALLGDRARRGGRGQVPSWWLPVLSDQHQLNQ